MGRGPRPGLPRRRSALRRLAVFLPAASTADVVEARPHCFDAVVLLQKDPHGPGTAGNEDRAVVPLFAQDPQGLGTAGNEARDVAPLFTPLFTTQDIRSPWQGEFGDAASSSSKEADKADEASLKVDPLRLSAVAQRLSLLRDAVQTVVPAGFNTTIVTELMRDLSSQEEGNQMSVESNDRTARILLTIQRVFDETSNAEMFLVMQTCDKLHTQLIYHRQQLRERCLDFERGIGQARPEDVIPMTATFMGDQVKALKPVIRDIMRDFVKLLQHVGMGQPYRWLLKPQLMIMEPYLVNVATAIFDPISFLIKDYDDLTRVGFCRQVSPMVLYFLAESGRMLRTRESVNQWKEDLVMQLLARKPTLEEAPAVFGVAERLADTASALLELVVEAMQSANSTVGEVVRQRLRCKEMSGTPPRTRSVLVSLLAGAVGVWRWFG